MILSTLVKIPVLHANIISRKNLLSVLQANNNKSLTLVCASAGAGKTALLTEFAISSSNIFWLQGDNLIDSPEELILYFIESLRNKYSQFGNYSKTYIDNSNSNIDINDLLIIFFNEISETFVDKIVFIIDDFHLIKNNSSNWLNKFMNIFFSHISDNIRIIIGTREYPEFETGRLKAKQNFAQLANRDLLFNENEISDLIDKFYPENKMNDTISELFSITNGWITGIHLILQSKSSICFKKGVNNKLTDQDIYNYFTEDIINRLDVEEKLFLMNTCFLEYFSLVDCKYLTDLKQPENIFSKLIKKNIFFEFRESNNTILYSYQKLFSNYLSGFFQNELSDENKINIYRTTAYISEMQNNLNSSIKFYVLAKEYDKAINIIQLNFSKYYERGEYNTLNKFFLLIEPDLFLKNITFLLLYFKFLISIGDLAIFKKYYEQAEKNNFSLLNNVDYLLCKAEFFILKGNFTLAIDILDNLTKQKLDLEYEIQKDFLLCKAYYRNGFFYYDKAKNIANLLLEKIDHEKFIFFRIEVLQLLGNIYYDAGDLNTSAMYFEFTLNCNTNGLRNFRTFTTLVDIYSLSGYFDIANDYIIKAKEYLIQFPLPKYQKLLTRSEIKFHNNFSNFQVAINKSKELQESLHTNANKLESLSFYYRLSEIFYNLGEKSQSLQIFNIANDFIENENDYYKMIHDFYKHFYCSENIDTIETEKTLLCILDYHINNKIFRPVPQFQFHLADHYIQAGNLSTAEDYLKKALNTISQKQYISFAEQQYILSRHVYDFAVSKNIEKKFIREIHTRLIEKKELSFIDEDFRKELEEQELNITDIRLEAFGTTDFYLRGSLIGDDKWIRKKSKILLAYLLSDPGKVHTRDKIMDMFFGELPPEKADVVYHSTLYNIRTALKIYNIKQDTPKRSKQKPDDYNPAYLLYEDKTLRLNPDFHYRSSNTDFEKLYSSSRVPGLTADEKLSLCLKAAEMYKGDFLPGYYDNWCEELRLKYKNMFVVLAEDLLSLLEAAGRTEEAARYAELLLNTDKLNDKAHLSIINSFARQHNTTAAKNRCRLMVKIYNEELGEDPPVNVMDMIKPLLDN